VRRLFGTDGIRARAYEFPLDLATVRRVGEAIGRHFGVTGRVLVGMDTRESSPALAAQLTAGLRQAGATVHVAGTLSTPALAWTARMCAETDLAVMISASHNPYADNGIKIFSKEGTKLPDAAEAAIEALLEEVDGASAGAVPVPAPEPDLAEPYWRWLLSVADPGALRGRTVVVDTAHGALSGSAQEVFGELGARVVTLGDKPDGRNINDGVGSQHPEGCRDAVREHGAWAGACFDGDGDRVVLVAGDGRIVDGDDILFLLASGLKAAGDLPGDGIVATIMTNLGVEEALRAEGIALHRAPVGDRYVWQALVERGWVLGGEQSGHIIDRRHATTGDGLLTALLALGAAARFGGLAGVPWPSRWPQRMVNLPVARKVPLEQVPGAKAKIAELEKSLDGGRLSVRYSGTEMKLRIMAEAREMALVDKAIEEGSRFFSEALVDPSVVSHILLDI
jgi:phosphoglucosamine mutase